MTRAHLALAALIAITVALLFASLFAKAAKQLPHDGADGTNLAVTANEFSLFHAGELRHV